MYTSTIRLAGVIVVASTLTGCASMNVNAYLAGGVNLRELRTYNWAPADAQSTVTRDSTTIGSSRNVCRPLLSSNCGSAASRRRYLLTCSFTITPASRRRST